MINKLANTLVLALGVFLCSLSPNHILAAGQTGEWPDFEEEHGGNRLFVINSPSTASRGPDSILTFDFKGHSSVLFTAEHNIVGLRAIACAPGKARQLLVSHSVFTTHTSGFLIFGPFGGVVGVPSGSPGTATPALAFDPAGNLYTVESVDGSAKVFKNDVLLANLPFTGIGQLAVDSSGNVYVTDPFVASRVFRIDQGGNVVIFADVSQGLNNPYGIAVNDEGDVFVANNPGSEPASILEFDPSGSVTTFASGISFQPIIRSLTFAGHDRLFATLEADNTILRFDDSGNAAVFATADDGLNLPAAITAGRCSIERRRARATDQQ